MASAIIISVFFSVVLKLLLMALVVEILTVLLHKARKRHIGLAAHKTRS